MHKSVDHILTTHTGSLPRGAELNDLLIADEAGEKVDQAKLTEKIDKRVAYVMEKQRWAGVRRRQRRRTGPGRLSDLSCPSA